MVKKQVVMLPGIAESGEKVVAASEVLNTGLSLSSGTLVFWACSLNFSDPAGFFIVEPGILSVLPNHGVEIFVLVHGIIIEVFIVALDEAILEVGFPEKKALFSVRSRTFPVALGATLGLAQAISSIGMAV